MTAPARLPRLARRLLDGLTVLSLLICLAALVLWVRSYFVGERWVLPPGRVTGMTTAPWGQTETWRLQSTINSGAGRLQVARMERQEQFIEPAGRTAAPPSQAVTPYAGGVTRSDRWAQALGFGYLKRDKQYYVGPQSRGSYWGFRVLTVPSWSVVAACGTPPALWLAAYASLRSGGRMRGICDHSLLSTDNTQSPGCEIA